MRNPGEAWRWRRAVAAVAVVLSAGACATEPPDSGTTPDALPVYDLLIRGGTVVDGTGAERFVAAVAMLALAIGIATATFTIVDAVILRPVPFDDAEPLAHVM